MSSVQKDNWMKSVFGMDKVKDGLIPTLNEHYRNKAEEYMLKENHLNHLLDCADQIKRVKKTENGSVWTVNCSDCRTILGEIEKTHHHPAHLQWNNNRLGDECPDDYRLAKIFMPGGNEDSLSYSDRDTLTILEIIRNDKRFVSVCSEVKYVST